MYYRSSIFLFVSALLMLFAIGLHADTVGFWTFDDIDYGNTSPQDAGFSDLSGSGLRGVIGWPFSLPEIVPGVSGDGADSAVSFDGRSGLYIDDSAAESLNLQPPFTLEAWVRSDVEQTGNFGIVTYGIPGGRTGGGGWKLGLNGGNIRFTLYAVVDLDSAAAFPFDGEWHHIAASYDGEIVLYFVDGVEMDAVAENRAVADPGAKDAGIGLEFNAISRFTGDIDRVRVSNVFLEADGLDSDPANIKPVDANTVAFYSFDEGALPFTSEGSASPALSAIASQEWALMGNVPRNNVGLPAREELSPAGDSIGDLSLLFDLDADTSAYVADPNGVLDFGPEDDWTIEAWVSTDLFYEEREVVFYYGRPGFGYSLSINPDGLLQVTTLGIADLSSSGAIVPNDYSWTHVAVAHKAGESMSYFINGELIETNEYTGGTNATGGGFLYIGSEWNGGLPYIGNVDRIRISNAALSADELDSVAGTVDVSEWYLY